MTETEFRKNYAELVRETTQMLKDYGEAALQSHAFDLKEEKTSFNLPKNVMCAALQECRLQWGPVSSSTQARASEKEISNIYKMTNLP